MEPNCGACGFPQSEHRIGHSRYRCHFVLPAPTAAPPADVVTEQQVQELEALLAQATPRPWRGVPYTGDPANAALIVSAVNILPLLVAEWRAGRSVEPRGSQHACDRCSDQIGDFIPDKSARICLACAEEMYANGAIDPNSRSHECRECRGGARKPLKNCPDCCGTALEDTELRRALIQERARLDWVLATMRDGAVEFTDRDSIDHACQEAKRVTT